MKKKWIIFAGVVVLIGILATVVFASSPIRLFVNGQEIKPDVPPQLINGRTMVPIRWVAEMLGAEVYWNEKDRIVGIEFSLPLELSEDWQYPLPGGGELSLGYLGREAHFTLPAVITLNDYLARKQKDSLYPLQENTRQPLLVRYELLDIGRTDGGMSYSEKTAYTVAARLYYSEPEIREDHPPYVTRLGEQKLPAGGTVGNSEELNFKCHWYEDTRFVIRPKGEIFIEKDEDSGRTTWIQGLEGWYIDEEYTQVLSKKELDKMPGLFDFPFPPAEYDYVLIKR